MIFKLIDLQYINIITFISLIAAFLTTCLIIKSCQGMLPRDQGRAFAINGKVSQGKPRGAGILFILVFSLFSLLFSIFPDLPAVLPAQPKIRSSFQRT